MVRRLIVADLAALLVAYLEAIDAPAWSLALAIAVVLASVGAALWADR